MATLNGWSGDSPPPSHFSSPYSHFFLTSIPLLLSATLLFFKWTSSRSSSKPLKLPPCPPGWPLVGNLFQFILAGKPFMHYVRDQLRPVYGPIFTLRMGVQTLIVVSSSDLVYEAFIEKGQLFANRPPEPPERAVFSANKFTVNSAEYGPVWRSLRRNLVSNMLSSTRLRQFAVLREASMERLVRRLRDEARPDGSVWVLSNARFAFFSILISMCFGFDMSEDEIVGIDKMMKKALTFHAPQIDDFIPLLRPLFAGRRKQALRIREEQVRTISPLLERRRAYLRGERSSLDGDAHPFAYLDTLFDLKIEGRPSTPSDCELVTLCAEFLNAGADTTATAIEWAVARMIDDPAIQSELQKEIEAVVGDGRRRVGEKDIERMPYLKAFVLEVLRKHPPTHLSLAHAALGPATLGGYDIPPTARLEIYLPPVALEERHWKEPERFDPGRFLGDMEEAADMTGVRGVKMMPFGVGRRICPGMGMALLHISMILATMVQEFEWATHPSQPKIDFEEKLDFTVVMKNPLLATIRNRHEV